MGPSFPLLLPLGLLQVTQTLIVCPVREDVGLLIGKSACVCIAVCVDVFVHACIRILILTKKFVPIKRLFCKNIYLRKIKY